MNKRPLSVTVIGWLFIAAGVAGLVYHAREFRTTRPVEYALVCFVRLLAVIGGAALLRGRDWARWLLLAWMTYHAVLSIFHTPAELAMHAALLVVIVYLLCRPAVAGYFRGAELRPFPVTPPPTSD
jgi:hypothetical protein